MEGSEGITTAESKFKGESKSFRLKCWKFQNSDILVTMAVGTRGREGHGLSLPLEPGGLPCRSGFPSKKSSYRVGVIQTKQAEEQLVLIRRVLSLLSWPWVCRAAGPGRRGSRHRSVCPAPPAGGTAGHLHCSRVAEVCTRERRLSSGPPVVAGVAEVSEGSNITIWDSW